MHAVLSKWALSPRYWILPIFVWTVIVATSHYFDRQENSQHAMELAAARGRFIFQMIESIRLWNARHGGIYVPVTESTRPNPYLTIDNRDLSTPQGVQLTMVNPAYMTRQLTDILRENTDVVAHITSLKPINPGNQADPWETNALMAFEQYDQLTEKRLLDLNSDIPLFRYMAPLITKKACLKCHEQQGYKVGDIRGGISVSFPATSFLDVAGQKNRKQLINHGIVWLLLSGITLILFSGIRRQLLSLRQVNAAQDELVEKRTRELNTEVHERQLAEESLRMLIDSSGEGIFGVDSNGNCTQVNPMALHLLGYDGAEELLGKNMRDLVYHSLHDNSPRSTRECRFTASYRDGIPAHDHDSLFWRKDGKPLPVEFRSHPMLVDGQVIGAVVTFADISQRKQQESELRKLSSAVEQSDSAVLITDSRAKIEYVNRKFTDITGYSAEEVIGKNARILQSGKTPVGTYQVMWSNLSHGKPWQGELLNRKKDGSLYWEELRISPVIDEHGTISHYVAVKDDITENKRSAEEIWRQANYDSLTGLPNRNLFHDRLKQALAQGRRSNLSTALLYLDLDGFKQVNDTLGHEAGDELLRLAAKRMSAYMRASDTVARMGGDEFTVILPMSPTRKEIIFVAQRIIDALAQPFDLKEGQAQIGTSIGIAINPDDTDEITLLIERADTAMYVAKHHGGANYCFYEDISQTN